LWQRDESEKEHGHYHQDVLDKQVEIAQQMRKRAIKVPLKVYGLRKDNVENAHCTYGWDKAIDQVSSRVRSIVFKPDNEWEEQNSDGDGEHWIQKKKN